eukprot:TRINITY_DN59475_c0_g1_i1.p1 TRINITY_DN59475_c0_g1~~TRINITY_DN59475_c0_g1_i1.p1  ORF type:complete len:140 (+),score=22.17 TRINITY_DN59475_c0_g1_i1:119-538(+)
MQRFQVWMPQKKLEEDGYNVEVIDLRSLIPLDEEMILESVKKTNKVLIAHEDKVFGGFGGELSALITEKAFEYLDAPVKRVGSTFTPVGFNTILERAILPDMKRIYDAAKDLISYQKILKMSKKNSYSLQLSYPEIEKG